MAARVIGLDIGSNGVRAVEVELTEPPTIRRMGQIGLPPGAVVEGEVADVGVVSNALRHLWEQVGFRSKSVRVGISSPRVIVRSIEMPPLPHHELLSTIRLQLEDYVPLPAAETVFDVRTLDGPKTSGPVSLLLAATYVDAVRPLVSAVADAGLRVLAVDVVPAALALALTHPEPDQPETADLVVSVGASTVVVVAARAGEALFVRTVTNLGGRRITERIAEQLSISEAEAECTKRLGDFSSVVGPNGATVGSITGLREGPPGVDELVAEVRASLAFYAEQPLARPVRRVLLTGGGALLTGLPEALAEQLEMDVIRADPFAGMRLGHTGFDPIDVPYLAPFMAAALGVALGARRPKDRRIDLRPIIKDPSRALAGRRFLVGVGAVVLVGAGVASFVSTRSDVAAVRTEHDQAETVLADLRAQVTEQQGGGSDVVTSADASPALVAASVADRNIDWLTLAGAVDQSSAAFGVVVSSYQGVLEAPVGAPGAAPTALGTLTLTATAPDLVAIANWLDALSADERYADPWIGGLTTVVQVDGSSIMQFTMSMTVTDKTLVDRSALVPA